MNGVQLTIMDFGINNCQLSTVNRQLTTYFFLPTRTFFLCAWASF